MVNKLWGYKPSMRRKALRFICRILIFVFRINGRSIFSNEFIQMLDPKVRVKFDNRDFWFKTGNGRLFWRAKTVLQEEPLMISWVRAMDSHDVVLDIGANVGMYTILIASKVATVYSCDLDPLNISVLKENLFLNDLLQKVKIIPLACGAKTEMVDVKFRSLSYGDALQLISGGDETQSSGSNEYSSGHISSVLQMSLDELFADAKLVKPNKIKIDVDGNELTVLQGAKDLILSANEVYFEDSLSDSCKTVVQFLLSVGFEKYQSVEVFSINSSDQRIGENIVFKK